MRILVVGDEAFLAIWMQALLEQAAHAIGGAVQTRAGVLAQAKAGEPDLILMEISLPDGRGAGIAPTRYAWTCCVIPSLFVTGQVEQVRANRDAALGCPSKPCHEAALLSSIEAAGQLMNGRLPRSHPRGLELFGTHLTLQI